MNQYQKASTGYLVLMEEWLTVSEAAERLEVGEERVRQMLREGYFPGAVKRGRPWFIPVGEIDAYLRLPRGVPGRPRRLRDVIGDA